VGGQSRTKKSNQKSLSEEKVATTSYLHFTLTFLPKRSFKMTSIMVKEGDFRGWRCLGGDNKCVSQFSLLSALKGEVPSWLFSP
jgi:hypothetical protein